MKLYINKQLLHCCCFGNAIRDKPWRCVQRNSQRQGDIVGDFGCKILVLVNSS